MHKDPPHRNVVANATDSVFFAASPADINSKRFGESERNVGRLFRCAWEEAERGRTVIVFLDEIDGFCTRRDEDTYEATHRIFGRLCTEMDGLPDLAARQAIFSVHLRRTPLGPDVDLAALAQATHGLSGAEIAAACQKAGYLAVSRYARERGVEVAARSEAHLAGLVVTARDLHAAVEMVRAECQAPGAA